MVDYRIAVDAARNSFDLLLERIGLEDLQLRQLALRQLFLAGELADAILELDDRLVELVVIRLELCARERSRETRMMSEGKRKKASVDGRGHSPRKRVTQTGFEARRAASRGARARTEPPSRRAASSRATRSSERYCAAVTRCLSPRPSRPILGVSRGRGKCKFHNARARTFPRRRLDAGDRADGPLLFLLVVEGRKLLQIRCRSARHRAAEDVRRALRQLPPRFPSPSGGGRESRRQLAPSFSTSVSRFQFLGQRVVRPDGTWVSKIDASGENASRGTVCDSSIALDARFPVNG